MSYEPYSDEEGNFGILDSDGMPEYETLCEFSERTAILACQILNAGRGHDGWAESDDPTADLLQQRLIEQGWSPAWDAKLDNT